MRLPLFILFAIAYASATHANDASYHGHGATVFEFKEERITMLRESIVIRYDASASDQNRQWLAECEFTFRNERNKPVEVQMGFPDWPALDEDAPESAGAIRDFKVSIAAKRIATKHKALARNAKSTMQPALNKLAYDSAYTWKVRFAPKQTLVIKNTYRIGGLATNGPFSACVGDQNPAELANVWWRRAPVENGSWDFENGACRRMTYIVTTGRTWGKPIGEANIAIQIPPNAWPHLVIPLPNAAKVEDGWVKWHFKDWSPERELHVVLVRPLFPDASPWLPLFDNEAQAREWTAFAANNGFSAGFAATLRQAYEVRHGARPGSTLAQLIESWGDPPKEPSPLSPVEQRIVAMLEQFEKARKADNHR